MNVRDAVLARHSVRAFLDRPVEAEIVRDLLSVAARTPSGGNLQPWRVDVMAGRPLAEFKRLVAERTAAGVIEQPEYDVYPRGLWEPLRARRARAADQRFRAFGVSGEPDPQAILKVHTYAFFGAPVGLFFSMDRRVGPPQWSDVGMFMQTLMLLAVERGLGTCPQEIWSNWPQTVAQAIGLPRTHMLFSGMALGYEDTDSPCNAFRTEREPLRAFATLVGFD
ncbi:MAG: nitroreductase [Burkholderiales bacterium]|nr:MAG: nitroreductase [Burkholderiales bacterium]